MTPRPVRELDCPEPAPYRPAEQVIREWVAHYGCLHDGRWPSPSYLIRKTNLARSVVYNYLESA